MRAEGRAYAEWCSKHAQKPYRRIFIALDLAEQAYRAHKLPYKGRLGSLGHFPPDRFTWIYDETGDAKECIKIRDNETGRIVVWPL